MRTALLILLLGSAAAQFAGAAVAEAADNSGIEFATTLGQLVAAELVLSAVFFGLSQLGTYLAYFYELCAALDELSLFDDIEQDELAGESADFTGDADALGSMNCSMPPTACTGSWTMTAMQVLIRVVFMKPPFQRLPSNT